MQLSLIERRAQTTDQTSPWTDISFIYDVESDDLADALKSAFPHHRTLRERKHAAVIDFFERELDEMRQSNPAFSSARTPPVTDLSSPTSDDQMEAYNGTPSRGAKAPPLSPASSINSAAHRDSDKYCPTTHTPLSQSLLADPTLAMSSTQLVFNAFDGRLIRQKTKRKMTDGERQEYKETRRRGACAKCKRQKGKCTHVEDASIPFDSTDMVAENFKRRTSLESDTNDLNPSKAPRIGRTNESYNRDPQQHAIHPQRPQLLQVRRCSSNASDRSRAASTEPQWHQLDMSGYVNPSRSFEQGQNSLTDIQIPPYWMDFGAPETEPLGPMDYLSPGTAAHTSQDGTMFPVSPSICVQAPDQESHYSSYFLPSSHWTLGQPPLSEDTG